MATERTETNFIDEFEQLKAAHGSDYALFEPVQFFDENGRAIGGPVADTPYVCRHDDATGFTNCEPVRQ